MNDDNQIDFSSLFLMNDWFIGDSFVLLLLLSSQENELRDSVLVLNTEQYQVWVPTSSRQTTCSYGNSQNYGVGFSLSIFDCFITGG